jgi:hypothetical protein
LRTPGGYAMYSIDKNARLKLITVTYSGNVGIAERSCALDEVATAIEVLGNSRIFLDFMDANVALDIFQASQTFARRVADLFGIRACRIAYLCPHDARVNKVVEMLAHARGLTFERFNDRVKALRWLLSDQPDQEPVMSGWSSAAMGSGMRAR